MVIRDTESTPRADGENAAADVVTVGEALLRLATPTGQRLDDAPALDVHVAGAEANVAAALATLGVRARWVSRLPDTPLGRRVATRLAAAGVLVDAVEWASADERLGLFFSDTGVPPRPAQVTYDRAGSAFTRLTQLPQGALDGARRLHLTGITAAVAVPGLVEDVLAEAAERDLAVSVDVNHRALLWDAPTARLGLRPLLAQAETVVCGEADARVVLELDGDAEAIAHGLRAAWAPRARNVVVTCGAEGCVALDARGEPHRAQAVEATVVDRFGMGDAFTAGLLWSLLDAPEDLARALHAGSALAALKATVAGDLAKTTGEELRAAMQGGKRTVLR